MNINVRIARFLPVCLLAVAASFCDVARADGPAPVGPTTMAGAGIYKGTYSSTASGGDYGIVTIVVNGQGGAVCDFYSTPNNYGVITIGGSVAFISPYLSLNCAGSGISNGGTWGARSDSSSVAGKSISGTWTSIVGPLPLNPPPTGAFNATFTSALVPIDPNAITGAWYQPNGVLGGFNFLASDAGFIATYTGVTNFSETINGQPVAPLMGTPYWVISGVGPKTIIPGTTYTLDLYGPPIPAVGTSLPTASSAGSMILTFIDCRTAVVGLNMPWYQTGMNLVKLAGQVGAPGC